jgi:hypothetical protein
MGANGRQYILGNLSREQTARHYISVLQELLGLGELSRAAAA